MKRIIVIALAFGLASLASAQVTDMVALDGSYTILRDSQGRFVIGGGVRPTANQNLGFPTGMPFYSATDQSWYWYTGTGWTSTFLGGSLTADSTAVTSTVPIVRSGLGNDDLGFQTSEAAEGSYTYAWKGITANTSATDFGLMVDTTPYFTGTVESARDDTLIFGYNVGSQNTPPVATEPAFTWNVETHYVNNSPTNDTHWLESYYQYVKPTASSGASFRPWTFQANRATSASIQAFNSDKTLFESADAQTVYLGIQASTNQVYLGTNTTLNSTTNNQPFVTQLNAAGTVYVPLIWLDTAGFVTLGYSTAAYVGVSVKMGTYGGLTLPAGTTAQYHYPLLFTAGPYNTSPYQGAMEYDGANLSFVPTAARGRETVLSTATNAAAPAAGDCDDAAETNRMVWDSTNDNLYICSGASGWRKVTTVAP